MLFATKVKDELTHIIPPRRCCRLWELAGLTHTCPPAGAVLRISLRQAGLARKCFLLQQDTGCQRPRLTMRRRGRRRYDIEIPGFPGLLCNDDGLPSRRCCRRAFIRGAFLAKGSLTDPERTYHLELVADVRSQADYLVAVLASLGVSAQEIPKRRGFVLYLKDGEAIGEFLRLVEAHRSLLDWENVRIVKSMKNKANRLVNAETANVDKTVTAAMMHKAGIAYLVTTVGWEAIPHRCREIARARLEMPYASLVELAESLEPPISKSAANYRLRRLAELALAHGFVPESGDREGPGGEKFPARQDRS